MGHKIVIIQHECKMKKNQITNFLVCSSPKHICFHIIFLYNVDKKEICSNKNVASLKATSCKHFSTAENKTNKLEGLNFLTHFAICVGLNVSDAVSETVKITVMDTYYKDED